jgi:hypothetical protein
MNYYGMEKHFKSLAGYVFVNHSYIKSTKQNNPVKTNTCHTCQKQCLLRELCIHFCLLKATGLDKPLVRDR